MEFSKKNVINRKILNIKKLKKYIKNIIKKIKKY